MKKLLLCTLCSIVTIIADAQIWTTYNVATTSTQLADNFVNDMIQDADSSFWFATNYGLSHYKGKTWKNYTKDNGLAANTVKCIAIDKQGHKWFGTTNGASEFDGKKWKNYKIKNGQTNNSVLSIAIDSDGSKWFGTDGGGLSRLDGNTWTNYNSSNGLTDNYVYSIAIDSSGIKWIGTGFGRISRFDGINWSSFLTHYEVNTNFVQTIAIDQKGVKWIGTKLGGFFKFNDTTMTFVNSMTGSDIHSVFIDTQNNKWVATDKGVELIGENVWQKVSGIVSDWVTSIIIDRQGNKWFGTDKGITMYTDSSSETYKTKSELRDNGITSIAVDNQGNKWLGYTFYGNELTKFDDVSLSNYKFFNDNNIDYVNQITFDSPGNLWLSLVGGTLKFDNTSWEYKSSGSTCLSIDAKGNKWMGTQSGSILKYNDTTVTEYLNPEGSGKSATAITIDAQGNKWLGSFGDGVSKFDGTTWTTYTEKDGLVFNEVMSIAVDAEGNKWIGTNGLGISRFNDSIWTTYNPLPGIGMTTFSIVIDALGNKWISVTGFGAFKFDGVKWTNYSVENGLSSNHVYEITIDALGNKWFATENNGFCKLADGGPGPLGKVQRGIVFNDLNGNGKKDFSETNVAGQTIKVDDYYTITQNNGVFYSALNKGSHTFTIRPKTNWKLTSDSSVTNILTDAQVKDTIYFGVQAIANRHAIQTSISGTATRAGFQSKSWLTYYNSGTVAESGTVSYIAADGVSLVQTIPVADSVIGNRLVWKFVNLIAGGQNQISILTKMPGVNSLGDTLVTISKIKSAFTQYDDTLKQVLTGSYDPNDKLVKQGVGSNNYILFGKELEYTVRFQNTGTDTAFNVNIRDTIDLNLDLASLRILSSSHPVKLEIRGQNEATFRFENILLPNQKVNDIGSNGFVKYTISPRKNLAENTIVKNKADIYFDFNPAIVTNQTLNTYVSTLPSSIVTDLQENPSNTLVSIYPNPAKNELHAVFPQTGVYALSLRNIQGTIVKQWNAIKGQKVSFSLDGLEPGMYLYTAQEENGKRYAGKLIVIN